MFIFPYRFTRISEKGNLKKYEIEKLRRTLSWKEVGDFGVFKTKLCPKFELQTDKEIELHFNMKIFVKYVTFLLIVKF